MAIDKEMIVSELRGLGVRRGDMIGWHSSMPSLGRVMINAQKQGGSDAINQAANEVIDAFVDTVSADEGLLVVPTFSYNFAGPKDAKAYHPKKTASKVGMITDLFFRRPDAHRSLHPTHSVAAIGASAEQFVKDHEKKTPIGIDSPFHRLAEGGGWICYMGTDSKTLSLLHLAEVLAKVPYLDVFCYECLSWTRAALVERGDGSVVEVPLREIPGCSEGFGKFDDLLAEAEIARSGKIYLSKVTMFKANEALELAVEKLKQDPFRLLCPKGSCKVCDVRWETIG